MNFAILNTSFIKKIKMNEMHSIIATYNVFASIVVISIISIIIGIYIFIMNSDYSQIIFTAFVTYIATYLWSFNLIKSRNANDIIKSRRSIIEFDTSKSIPRYIFKEAINDAILAPNHFLTEPWRFYKLGKETLEEVFKLNESNRIIFESKPNWLVVTMNSKYEKNSKLYYEDYAACACACQNFMLSLNSNNIGSKWVTGALQIQPTELLKTINADNNEIFIGVIWYGYSSLETEKKAPTRKLGVNVLTELR